MDKFSSHQQQHLIEILRQQILPWAQAAGSVRVVVAEPPPRLPANVSVRRCPVPPLPVAKDINSGVFLARWPEHHLNSIRVPFVGLVLEGEADFAIGATRNMLRGCPASDKPCGRYVLTLPAFTCCLVPPGVPHADGTQPLWERPNPERAYSRVFWLHILPTGALCHIFTTTGLKHTIEPYLFVHDTHFAAIVELMLDEARERGAHFEMAARSYLTALVIRLEQALSQGQSLAPGTAAHAGTHFAALPEANLSLGATVLQRACHYIQMHIHEPLTPTMIARHVYVSLPHLNRIFNAGMGMPVMHYVSACRKETAQSLLEDTDLAVAQIGRLVGLPNASHFTHAFRRWHKLSPSAYRKLQRRKT